VGAKNAKNGSEPEPKEVEHGGKVIADRILILLISKADGIMTRHSLRQRFQQSGLPDAARALDQSCAEVNSVQKQLVNVLREVAHPDIGVIAEVRSANDSLLRSMATRAQQMDDFLVRLEKQIWAIWLPVVASAALALGSSVITQKTASRYGLLKSREGVGAYAR